MLQTLMLPTRKKRKPNSSMIPRMLIMIPQPIHILIPPLTIPNTTRKRPQPLLSLLLHLPQLRLGDVPQLPIRQHPLLIPHLTSNIMTTGSSSSSSRTKSTATARTPSQPSLPFLIPPLPLQKILNMLQILRRRKVAAPMRHVVLEPIRLLVRFIAIRLRAPERL